MDAEASNDRPVLATGVPVAIIAVLHVAISTTIIAVVQPDVPDLVPYWIASVLIPVLGWALLVLGRAAVWRTPSAFWLGASAGIVVLVAFMVSLLLYLGDARLGDISARGVPLALIYSSWVLLGCAVLVALVLRALGKQVDVPMGTSDEPPAPQQSTTEPAQQSTTEPAPQPDEDVEAAGAAPRERR